MRFVVVQPNATAQQLSQLIKERVFCQPGEARPNRPWLCRLSFRFLKQQLDSISEEENEKPNKLKSDVNSNIK